MTNFARMLKYFESNRSVQWILWLGRFELIWISNEIAFKMKQAVTPERSFFFFFITLKPRVELFKSL